MNTTIVTRLIYGGLAIAAYVLEHYNILPSGTANVVLGVIGGAASVSGAFVPKASTATSVPTQSVPPSNGDMLRG